MMLFALFKKRQTPLRSRHYKKLLICLMNGRPDHGILKFI